MVVLANQVGRTNFAGLTRYRKYFRLQGYNVQETRLATRPEIRTALQKICEHVQVGLQGLVFDQSIGKLCKNEDVTLKIWAIVARYMPRSGYG